MMQIDPGVIALSIPIVAIGGGFLTAIVATLAKHQQKMAELRLRSRAGVPEELQAQIREIKQQMNEIRDTGTRFDMSFDAALTRLEERVDRLETRQVTMGANQNGAADAEATATLTPRV
jgi:TolA-binding protein